MSGPQVGGHVVITADGPNPPLRCPPGRTTGGAAVAARVSPAGGHGSLRNWKPGRRLKVRRRTGRGAGRDSRAGSRFTITDRQARIQSMIGRAKVHGRRRRVRRGGLATAGTILAVHLTGVNAWAQALGRIPNEDAGWMQWVIGGAIIIVVCAMGFVPSKRSHLT